MSELSYLTCGSRAHVVSHTIGREPARVLILLYVSIPPFMRNLGANIVAGLSPAIAHSLKADFAAIEWVVGALAAVSAIATWLTVRSSAAAPGPSDVSSTSSMACAPQSLTFSTFKE
jgi:hypothetical protein